MKKFFAFVLLISVGFVSCDDELKSGDEDLFFDKISLLTNIADNHIIPEYTAFVTDVTEMVAAKNNFVASKTEANLIALRNSYLKAYTTFQPAAKYGFGLAEAGGIKFYQNTNSHAFRLREGGEENINIESFILNFTISDLEKIENQDRQGFPAMDYLLNGVGATDTDILEFYTNSNGTKYTEYLSEIVDKIADLSNAILSDWQTKSRSEFVTDAAFVNITINAYIQYFEKRLRSSKIGFPSGKFGTPSPESVESVFKPEESKRLLLEALESSRIFYTGINDEVQSLSKVLRNLEKEGVDAQIKLKFLEARSVIEALDDNLKQQIETDNSKMLEARDALQEVIRLLKIDLTSILNVSITFIDNDGD